MSAVCIPKVHHFYLTLLTLENMHIFLYDPGQVKNTGMESENKFTSKNHI